MARIVGFSGLESRLAFRMVDPVDLFEGLLLDHATNVGAAVHGRRKDYLGLFLKHRYSFDGKESVNPLHLRGSDAIVCEALARVFAVEKPLITRQLKSIKAQDSERDRGPLWYIYREVIREWPCEEEDDDGNNDESETSFAVKEKYRHLLPDRMSSYELFNMSRPSDIEDDTSVEDEFFVPLKEKALFAITKEDKKRMTLEETDLKQRFGNFRVMEIYCYKFASALVPLRLQVSSWRPAAPKRHPWLRDHAPNVELPGVLLTDGEKEHDY
ncbi:MAG: hypothetical protein SGARI_004031 [Bacillariaceae sp.]